MALPAVLLLSACGGTSRVHLSSPASLSPDETYLCAIAALNQLGYRIDRAERAARRLEGRSIRQRGWTSTREPLHDEIIVSLAQEPGGDVVHVIATDRGHAEEILERCSKT